VADGERLRIAAIGEDERRPFGRNGGQDPLQGPAGQARGIARRATGGGQVEERGQGPRRPVIWTIAGRRRPQVDRLAGRQEELRPGFERHLLTSPVLLARRRLQQGEEGRFADREDVPMVQLLLADRPAVDERAMPAVQVGDAPPRRDAAQDAMVAGHRGIRNRQIVRRMPADREPVAAQVERLALETAAQGNERRGHQLILGGVL
jgi:hypothetical protein